MKWFFEQIFDISPGIAILFVGSQMGELMLKASNNGIAFGYFILALLCCLASAILTQESLKRK